MDSHTTQRSRSRSSRRGGSRRSGRTTRLHAPQRPQSIDRPQAAYDPVPVPFDTLGLNPALLEGVRLRGFASTTPIQSAVIPIALGGADVIGCADTGTGKTVAFVLPILHRLLQARAARAARPAS